MKKVYSVYCEEEHNTGGLEAYVNSQGFTGTFKTRKEATKNMIECARWAKCRLYHDLEEEKKNGNVIILALYVHHVDDEYQLDDGTEFEYPYEMVDSRYLCGRY